MRRTTSVHRLLVSVGPLLVVLCAVLVSMAFVESPVVYFENPVLAFAREACGSVMPEIGVCEPAPQDSCRYYAGYTSRNRFLIRFPPQNRLDLIL